MLKTIYPHRWAMWSVAFAISLAIIGWGSFEIHAIGQELNITSRRTLYLTRLYSKIVEMKIDTANWVAYKDKAHGFELKYPNGWREIFDVGGFKIQNNFSGGLMSVSARAQSIGEMSVENYARAGIADNNFVLLSVVKSFVGGVEVVKTTAVSSLQGGNADEIVAYYVPLKSGLYAEIKAIYSPRLIIDSELEAIFLAIVKSFQLN